MSQQLQQTTTTTTTPRQRLLVLVLLMTCLSMVHSFATTTSRTFQTTTPPRSSSTTFLSMSSTSATVMEGEDITTRIKHVGRWSQPQRLQSQRLQQSLQRRHTANASLVQTITTMKEYKQVVMSSSSSDNDNNDSNALVVVRYYATWCRSCRAMESKFFALARRYRGNHGIKFVQMPLTKQNAFLHQQQQQRGGSSSFYCHVFHPTAGKVEEIAFTKHNLSLLQDKIHSYMQGYCNIV